MNQKNYMPAVITALVVGAGALIVGLIPKSQAGMMQCGSILAPGKHASFPGCDGVNTTPAALIYLIIAASLGVVVYLAVLHNQANDTQSTE